MAARKPKGHHKTKSKIVATNTIAEGSLKLAAVLGPALWVESADLEYGNGVPATMVEWLSNAELVTFGAEPVGVGDVLAATKSDPTALGGGLAEEDLRTGEAISQSTAPIMCCWKASSFHMAFVCPNAV